MFRSASRLGSHFQRSTTSSLAALGDNLEIAWHFNNATKKWTFYDPRPAFADSNTLEALVPGEAYLIRVNDDQSAILDGKEHRLLAGWNFIGW